MLKTGSILDRKVKPALAIFIDICIGGQSNPPPASKVERLSSIEIRDSVIQMNWHR